MTRREHSAEWIGRIGEGDLLAVPPAVAGRLGLARGSVIHVRLTRSAAATALRRRGIADEEVDRIAEMQREPRAQVERFLLSEGALRGRARRKRA